MNVLETNSLYFKCSFSIFAQVPKIFYIVCAEEVYKLRIALIVFLINFLRKSLYVGHMSIKRYSSSISVFWPNCSLHIGHDLWPRGIFLCLPVSINKLWHEKTNFFNTFYITLEWVPLNNIASKNYPQEICIYHTLFHFPYHTKFLYKITFQSFFYINIILRQN